MKRLLSGYIAYHQAKGTSSATIKSYLYHLELYQCWLGDRCWSDANNIIRWLAHRRELELSDYTIRGHYRALSAFVKWCLHGQHIAESPLYDVPVPVVRPKVPRRTDYNLLDSILESIPCDRWTDLRDIAMLHVLYWSALRVGELVSLRICDVDLHEQLLRVSGKMGERLVVVVPDAVVALDVYIRQRPQCDHDALWVKDDGIGRPNGPVATSTVREMLRRRCLRAGVNPVNPHSFRHGFAVDALNAGMDIAAVSRQLGHSTVVTTERHYAQHTVNSLRNAVNDVAQRMRGDNEN